MTDASAEAGQVMIQGTHQGARATNGPKKPETRPDERASQTATAPKGGVPSLGQQ
jgi:hypothetical protein